MSALLSRRFFEAHPNEDFTTIIVIEEWDRDHPKFPYKHELNPAQASGPHVRQYELSKKEAEIAFGQYRRSPQRPDVVIQPLPSPPSK